MRAEFDSGRDDGNLIVERPVFYQEVSDEALEAAGGSMEWELVSKTPSSGLPCCPKT